MTIPNCRYPILGAYYQPRGGTARHDAVAWGYARGADALGVDIIQNCEVTGITREGGKVTGLETTRGFIKTKKIGVVTAGHVSTIMQMAGVRMPIESLCLQALVSEPIKPVHRLRGHGQHGAWLYQPVGQGRTGDRRRHRSLQQLFAARLLPGARAYGDGAGRNLPDHFAAAHAAHVGRHRRHDGRPLADHFGKTDVEGLYVNCGWGTGGFKAIPGSGYVFADTIANDRPHPIAEPFGLNRFAEGRLIDESVAAAVAH